MAFTAAEDGCPLKQPSPASPERGRLLSRCFHGVVVTHSPGVDPHPKLAPDVKSDDITCCTPRGYEKFNIMRFSGESWVCSQAGLENGLREQRKGTDLAVVWLRSVWQTCMV